MTSSNTLLSTTHTHTHTFNGWLARETRCLLHATLDLLCVLVKSHARLETLDATVQAQFERQQETRCLLCFARETYSIYCVVWLNLMYFWRHSTLQCGQIWRTARDSMFMLLGTWDGLNLLCVLVKSHLLLERHAATTLMPFVKKKWEWRWAKCDGCREIRCLWCLAREARSLVFSSFFLKSHVLLDWDVCRYNTDAD